MCPPLGNSLLFGLSESNNHLQVNNAMFVFLELVYFIQDDFLLFFIHPLVEGHLGCFPVSDYKNKTTMDRVEQVSLLRSILWVYVQVWYSWVLR